MESDGGEEEEEDEEAEFEEETSEGKREGGKEESVPADEEAEEMLTEEGAGKTEEPSPAEEGQAGSSSEDATLKPVSQATARAPLQRKRVSSKSLKVGMIPAQKRVCHVEEPQGKGSSSCRCDGGSFFPRASVVVSVPY